MMTGAHRDALLVEQGGDVMGVDFVKREGDDPAPVLRMAMDGEALDPGEGGNGVFG